MSSIPNEITRQDETGPALQQGPDDRFAMGSYAGLSAFFFRSRFGTSRSSTDFAVAGFS